MNGYPGVGEYVEQMKLKFIKDFAPQKSRLRDLNESISAKDHFEHLKYVLNELYNVDQKDFIDEILCLTILTPRYPASYFEFFNPDFISKILQNINLLDLHEIMFHSLVQFLLPQDPEMSINLLKLIFSKQYSKPSVMDSLYDFWDNLKTLPETALSATEPNSNKEQNELISKKVSMIVQILRTYRDTRRKSSSIIPLPSFTFFPIIHQISQILAEIDFNNSLPLLTLLAIEPLFAFPLVEKRPQPISIRNLPPLSMVYQVQDPLPHSFVSMYRPILMPIFELFGIFSKYVSPEIAIQIQINKNDTNFYQSNSDNSNNQNKPTFSTPTTINISLAPFHHTPNTILNSQLSITQICQNFLKIIESGPAGRDAFSLSLLSLCRSDKNNYVAERFYNYISNKNINSIEHDICVAGFIFAFDSVPFPSTCVLIEVDSEHLLKTMKNLHDNYSLVNNTNKNQNKKKTEAKRSFKNRNTKNKSDSYKGSYKSNNKNNDNDEYKDNDYDENGNNEYNNDDAEDDDEDDEENEHETELTADLESEAKNENYNANFSKRAISPFAMKVNHVYQFFNGNDPNISLLTSAYALIYAYIIDHLDKNQNETNTANNTIKTPRRGRKPKNKRAPRVIKTNKIKKHSYSNLIHLIISLSKKLNEPDYFTAFCCLVESHAKNYFEREKPSVFQTPTVNYISTVAMLLMTALPMTNFPIWHYIFMLRENAISAVIKLISFEDLIAFMRDPFASPTKLLGASFALLRFISSSPMRMNDYAKLLCEGNPPAKIPFTIKKENENEADNEKDSENENNISQLTMIKNENTQNFSRRFSEEEENMEKYESHLQPPPTFLNASNISPNVNSTSIQSLNTIHAASANIEMPSNPNFSSTHPLNIINYTTPDQINSNINYKTTSNISSPPLNLLIPKPSTNENTESKNYDFNSGCMIQKQIEQQNQQKAQTTPQFHYQPPPLPSTQIHQQTQPQPQQPPPQIQHLPPQQQPRQPLAPATLQQQQIYQSPPNQQINNQQLYQQPQQQQIQQSSTPHQQVNQSIQRPSSIQINQSQQQNYQQHQNQQPTQIQQNIQNVQSQQILQPNTQSHQMQQSNQQQLIQQPQHEEQQPHQIIQQQQTQPQLIQHQQQQQAKLQLVQHQSQQQQTQPSLVQQQSQQQFQQQQTQPSLVQHQSQQQFQQQTQPSLVQHQSQQQFQQQTQPSLVQLQQTQPQQSPLRQPPPSQFIQPQPPQQQAVVPPIQNLSQPQTQLRSPQQQQSQFIQQAAPQMPPRQIQQQPQPQQQQPQFIQQSASQTPPRQIQQQPPQPQQQQTPPQQQAAVPPIQNLSQPQTQLRSPPPQQQQSQFIQQSASQTPPRQIQQQQPQPQQQQPQFIQQSATQTPPRQIQQQPQPLRQPQSAKEKMLHQQIHQSLQQQLRQQMQQRQQQQNAQQIQVQQLNPQILQQQEQKIPNLMPPQQQVNQNQNPTLQQTHQQFQQIPQQQMNQAQQQFQPHPQQQTQNQQIPQQQNQQMQTHLQQQQQTQPPPQFKQPPQQQNPQMQQFQQQQQQTPPQTQPPSQFQQQQNPQMQQLQQQQQPPPQFKQPPQQQNPQMQQFQQQQQQTPPQTQPPSQFQQQQNPQMQQLQQQQQPPSQFQQSPQQQNPQMQQPQQTINQKPPQQQLYQSPPQQQQTLQPQPQMQQQQQQQSPQIQQFQSYLQHPPPPQPIHPPTQLQPPPQQQIQLPHPNPTQQHQPLPPPPPQPNRPSQIEEDFPQPDTQPLLDDSYRIKPRSERHPLKPTSPPPPQSSSSRSNVNSKPRGRPKSIGRGKHRGRPRLNLSERAETSTQQQQTDSKPATATTAKPTADMINGYNGLSFLTNTATRLAVMELPHSYRLLCELMNFSAFFADSENSASSGGYGENGEVNGPLFEDALIEEIDRLSRKHGYRFFFRISTALFQNSLKFPSFLASYPNHGDTFLNILASFVFDDEEESSAETGENEGKQILKTASFIWTWKSLGCCKQFVDIFGQKLATLILMSYHADPSSEFFFKSLAVVLQSQFSQMEKNQDKTESFFNALQLDSMEKSPLFDRFVNSLPSAFAYLKPSNLLSTNELLISEYYIPFPIEFCQMELTGKYFSSIDEK